MKVVFLALGFASALALSQEGPGGTAVLQDKLFSAQDGLIVHEELQPTPKSFEPSRAGFLPHWQFARDATDLSADPTDIDKPSEYNIELSTIRDCLYGGCPRRFTEKNFSVSQSDREYPVHVASPEFPTHLLILFPANVVRPDNVHLLRELKDVLERGWLISTNRSDGSLTPYSSRAELIRELAATSAQPAGVEQEELADRQAVETLATFPGRRVLLIGLTRTQVGAPPWLAKMSSAIAPIYIVDGGESRTAYRDSSWGYSRLNPDVVSSGDYAIEKKRTFHDGAFHEKTISEALKDAVSNQRFNYDLRFDVAGSHFDITSSIILILHNAKGLLPYDADATVYTVRTHIENGKRLLTRVPSKQQVLTKDK